MKIRSEIQLPVESRDPQFVVGEYLRLIWANAAELRRSRVHAGLLCTGNNGVILALANRLPGAALGFTGLGSDRAKTAAEFIAEPDEDYCTFSGDLTDHFSCSAALDLIEELLRSPAQAIRSTIFNLLDVTNLRWKGSPEDSSGSLNLFDLKAFKKAQRFLMTATLELAGDDPKADTVAEALKRVSDATGLAFQNAAPARVLGEERDSPAHARAILIGQICFDEAILDAISRLRSVPILQSAAGALPKRLAFSTRLERFAAGGSERVDLLRLIKSAVKKAMPDFGFSSAEAEEIIFKKALTANAEVTVTFMKSLPRVGKAFTVLLGIHAKDSGIHFEANVFRLVGTREGRIWVYAERTEAVAAIEESLGLLEVVIPVYESVLRSYFDPWPKELPQGIQRLGKLTAREAFDIAWPMARKEYADAELARLGNFIRSLRTRDIEGPELSMDGRLGDNAAWWFHFFSKAQDVSFEVLVPAVGRVQLLDHGEQYKDPNARHYLVAVRDNWMDSDRAFAIAEERGGGERRGSGRMFGISTKMQRAGSGEPYWGIMYLIVDQRGRNDLIVNLNAITGENIDVRGF